MQNFDNIEQNKIFSIKNTKFYLPHYTVDCISRSMVSSKDYWDNWEGGALSIIDSYLQDNAVILDIGANIGSHTIYWAVERNAKKVYSFEPLPDTYRILNTNIELNSLKNRVQTFNFALSDENCKGVIDFYNKENIGGTSFKKYTNGDVEFRQLDKINIPEKIDLIKIDVEGAEVLVLKGAKETIVKNKPIIVLETYIHKNEVDNFMNSVGYKLDATIRAGEDYIYKYAG